MTRELSDTIFYEGSFLSYLIVSISYYAKV